MVFNMYLCNLDLSPSLIFTFPNLKIRHTGIHPLLLCIDPTLSYSGCMTTTVVPQTGGEWPWGTLSLYLSLTSSTPPFLCLIWSIQFLVFFLMVPFFLVLSWLPRTHGNITERLNNSSQVQFCSMVYSWLLVSLTPLFLLLMSCLEMVSESFHQKTRQTCYCI